MKQSYGYSGNGDVAQAAGAVGNPQAVIFIAGKDHIDKAAQGLKARFPDAAMIGCVGQCYAGKHVYEDGLLVIGFEGVQAVANVIRDVGTMPLAGIERLMGDVQAVKAGNENTVCVDFTTGNDAQLETTFNIALKEKKIPLVGGTAWEDTVACDGRVYHNACVYLLLKNQEGKIRAYKENLYEAHPGSLRYVASKVDPDKAALYELDGKPVQKVYAETIGYSGSDLAGQTLKYPFGRIIGDDVYLLSIKEAIGKEGFACYKKVNFMDIITIMELKDIDGIVKETLQKIKSDLPQVKGVFTINCLFRHLLFQQEKYEDTYLGNMETAGVHAGMIGLGEHYKTQHVNQTMSGFAFD